MATGIGDWTLALYLGYAFAFVTPLRGYVRLIILLATIVPCAGAQPPPRPNLPAHQECPPGFVVEDPGYDPWQPLEELLK